MRQGNRVTSQLNKPYLNKEFSAALFEPDAPLPEGVTGPRGKKAIKRFAVYRNNVMVSLLGAMADLFPAVQTLLGEKSFADVAQIFIVNHPPKVPMLFAYGDDFPDFLAAFKPLSAYPFLPALALLERRWLDAFHAADAAALKPSVLADTDDGQVGELIFIPHPATALVESKFAIATLLTRCRENQPLEDLDLGAAETALVTRARFEVEVRTLVGGSAAFFRSLLDRNTLAEAASSASELDPQFDLPAAITTLISSGAFSAAELKTVQTPVGDEK